MTPLSRPERISLLFTLSAALCTILGAALVRHCNNTSVDTLAPPPPAAAPSAAPTASPDTAAMPPARPTHKSKTQRRARTDKKSKPVSVSPDTPKRPSKLDEII